LTPIGGGEPTEDFVLDLRDGLPGALQRPPAFRCDGDLPGAAVVRAASALDEPGVLERVDQF